MDHDRYSNSAAATRSDRDRYSGPTNARWRRAEALLLKCFGGEFQEPVARAKQAVGEILTRIVTGVAQAVYGRDDIGRQHTGQVCLQHRQWDRCVFVHAY